MEWSWIQWAVPVATAAAAWGSVKVGLNGTRENVREIKHTLKDHVRNNDEKHEEIFQRVAVIETKVDIMSSSYEE